MYSDKSIDMILCDSVYGTTVVGMLFPLNHYGTVLKELLKMMVLLFYLGANLGSYLR